MRQTYLEHCHQLPSRENKTTMSKKRNNKVRLGDYLIAINDRDKILVVNNDELWRFLFFESYTVTANQCTFSCTTSICELLRNLKPVKSRMMESGAEGRESEVGHGLELSHVPDVIVDKRGYMTLFVWQWFGYSKNDMEQIKPVLQTDFGRALTLSPAFKDAQYKKPF